MKSSWFLLLVCLTGSCMLDSKKHAEVPAAGTIRAGGSEWYYEMKGTGEALVFIHAGFMDHSMWDKQVAYFSKNYKVITVDLPAHGQTKNVDSVGLVADALKQVLDALKISKANFVGLSLGGGVVTDFALAYPDRIHKIVLAGSGINGYETKYMVDSVALNYFNDLMSTLEKKDTAAAAEVFIRYWYDGPYRKPGEVDSAQRQWMYEKTYGTMIAHRVRGWPQFAKPPAVIRIDSIRVPALILAGDKDMRYILDAAEVLDQRIPKSRRVIIPGVAHMMNLEKPEEFNRVVESFLKSN